MADLRSPDRITLTGVTAYGHHGVLAQEKSEGQEFSVDLALEVDLSRAGASDDLRHTVNYAEVAADAVTILQGPSQDLIETVATQIADAVLTRPLVEAVEVTLHKPHAPVGVPFSDVTVALRRERDVPVVFALAHERVVFAREEGRWRYLEQRMVPIAPRDPFAGGRS